jgi:hypothetical protein
MKKKSDWTCDSKGRSNSSREFQAICNEVECMIRGEAFTLLSGRADQTARLIVAQLAHAHGLAPKRT